MASVFALKFKHIIPTQDNLHADYLTRRPVSI